jgi:CelD/BcsL family acetyltransferase involved in cellulose biosynthesis
MLQIAAHMLTGGAPATASVRREDACPKDWRNLADDASEPTAFCEEWFLGPALRHLQNGSDVRLVDVRDGGGNLIGLIPLTRHNRYGRMPVRHVRNWMHFQCFMGSPLVRRGEEEPFWLAIIDWLDASNWAQGLFTLSGILEDGPLHRGLAQAAQLLGRPCPTVHRYSRAALASTLAPEEYLATHVRSKKRKELRRLANRLADTGTVSFHTLSDSAQLGEWNSVFLALEAAGWKGERGAAMGNDPATRAFFAEMMSAAYRAGKLDFQRLDLDGRAIAMLINFRTPPGSWSFKIAYDEDLARFSPGVLIELENLAKMLNDPEIDWMDSCAVQDHPMINSLWAERRTLVQLTVPLSGARRQLIYRTCHAAETSSAWLRNTLGRTGGGT